MIAMFFDLSSVCIGVTFAQIKNNQVEYAETLAIIPETPSAKQLGYTTKEPKYLHYQGNKFLGLLKPDEVTTSKKEAERRIAEYKNFRHKELLKDIGKQCGFYLNSINPDVIALEKNKVFNGVLTTKLLAEIAGGIYFYAGANNIELYDYDVNTIRAKIRKDIPDFTYPDDKIVLDSKYEIYCRLQTYFNKNYPELINFSTMTMDESDSLAVFYYYLTTERKI